MAIERASISCGVRQLSRLAGPPIDLLKEIWETTQRPNGGYGGLSKGAYFIYSDKTTTGVEARPSNGVKFTEWLLEQELGVVYDTEPTRNPNSGNQIILWTFAPNYRKLKAFAREQGWEPPARRRGPRHELDPFIDL